MSPTIIFGLDGATYTVLDDLMARGLMPNMAAFLEQGVKATLLSITPPLTPPAWTSLVTGRTPGHHGVFGFFQYDSPETRQIQLISSRQVRAETLWSMVNRQGRKAGVLNFVAHQPAPKVDGWVIPGWVSWRWLKRFSSPPTLVDSLKANVPSFDVKTLSIDFEEERKAVSGAPIDDHRDWVNLHIQREQQWFDVLWYQMEHDTADLAAVVFDGVDKLQHGLWPYLDPRLEPKNPEPEFERTRAMAWEYYKTIDNLLGETMKRAGEDATILICSDHGFTGSQELLYINTWLEQQGFLTWRADYDPPEDSLDINPTFYQHNGFDMAKTKAYAITTSSNGIYIPVRSETQPDGIDPADYDTVRNELIDALLTKCVHPVTGENLVKRVWTREEIFDGPLMRSGPDLTLTLRDNGFFSVRRSTKVYAERPFPLGTHHPEGVLMAKGPGIRQGAHLETPVHLIDIAPTALYSMGLAIPRDLPGRFLEQLYQPGYLQQNPIRWTGSGDAASTDGPAAEEQPAEDQEILAQLKALGYIE